MDDNGEGVITNKDVCVKNSRSFATVRAALTEKRSQAGELRRQTALYIAKVEDMAVGLKRALQNYNLFEHQLASIEALLHAAETTWRTSADTAAAAGATCSTRLDDTDDWGGAVKKGLQKQLKVDFADATRAWPVFRTVEELKYQMVGIVMSGMELPTDEARTLLMGQVSVPVRKRSKTTLVAYRYLKRTIYKVFESLSKAGKAYIARVNTEPQMGSLVRKTMEFSPSESVYLLDGDRFTHESYGDKGHVDGGFAVASFIGGGEKFSEKGGPGGTSTVLV